MIYSHFFPPKRILLGWHKIFQKTLKQKQNIWNDLFLSPAPSIPIWLSYLLPKYLHILFHLQWNILMKTWSIHIWNFENFFFTSFFFYGFRNIYLSKYQLYLSPCFSNNMHPLLGCKFTYLLCKSYVADLLVLRFMLPRWKWTILYSLPHWNIYCRSFMWVILLTRRCLSHPALPSSWISWPFFPFWQLHSVHTFPAP